MLLDRIYTEKIQRFDYVVILCSPELFSSDYSKEMILPEDLLQSASALKRVLDDLYEKTKEVSKQKHNLWQNKKKINELYKKISSVLKVKTFWQIDKDVNLKSFYFPARLKIKDDKTTVILNAIKKIPSNSNIVIQGTVGQGKSILMRYLTYQEMLMGTTIPVFLELRKIQTGESLKANISLVLESLGFDMTSDTFDAFCESGTFTFLLDGFDEVREELVPALIRELEIFSEKYPQTKIIVSSRPNSGIQASSYFHVFELAYIRSEDFAPLLSKLIKDPHQVENIVSALNSNSTDIRSLLTTPLMITLLVIAYKSEQKIPEQFSEFYEKLFQTLLYRHDKSKPGYVRKRKSSLNERQLQIAFEAFCFCTKRKNLVSLNNAQMHECAITAAKLSGLTFDTQSFIDDITKVTCLILEEAFEYHFVHKSVQEYHVASFVKQLPEQAAEDLYHKLRPKWNSWQQELAFLKQLDSYRFSKYFAIPDYISFLERLGVPLKNWDGNVSDQTLEYIVKDVVLCYQKGERISSFHSPFFNSATFAVNELMSTFVNFFVSPCFDISRNTPIPEAVTSHARVGATIGTESEYELTFKDWIDLYDFRDRFISSVASYINSIYDHIQEYQNIVDHHENLIDLIDLKI